MEELVPCTSVNRKNRQKPGEGHKDEHRESRGISTAPPSGGFHCGLVLHLCEKNACFPKGKFVNEDMVSIYLSELKLKYIIFFCPKKKSVKTRVAFHLIVTHKILI